MPGSQGWRATKLSSVNGSSTRCRIPEPRRPRVPTRFACHPRPRVSFCRMSHTHFATCTLCEATCGVAVEVDAGRITSIRGDEADPFSRGYICPKAAALQDLYEDPDRLRT